MSFFNNSIPNGITHLQLNNKKKRFPCIYCEKSFDCNSKLIVHLRVHTGERPFQCGLCAQRFKRKDHLKRHQNACENKSYFQFCRNMNILLTGQKGFRCKECGFTCSFRNHVFKHIRSVHLHSPINVRTHVEWNMLGNVGDFPVQSPKRNCGDLIRDVSPHRRCSSEQNASFESSSSSSMAQSIAPISNQPNYFRPWTTAFNISAIDRKVTDRPNNDQSTIEQPSRSNQNSFVNLFNPESLNSNQPCVNEDYFLHQQPNIVNNFIFNQQSTFQPLVTQPIEFPIPQLEIISQPNRVTREIENISIQPMPSNNCPPSLTSPTSSKQWDSVNGLNGLMVDDGDDDDSVQWIDNNEDDEFCITVKESRIDTSSSPNGHLHACSDQSPRTIIDHTETNIEETNFQQVTHILQCLPPECSQIFFENKLNPAFNNVDKSTLNSSSSRVNRPIELDNGSNEIEVKIVNVPNTDRIQIVSNNLESGQKMMNVEDKDICNCNKCLEGCPVLRRMQLNELTGRMDEWEDESMSSEEGIFLPDSEDESDQEMVDQDDGQKKEMIDHSTQIIQAELGVLLENESSLDVSQESSSSQRQQTDQTKPKESETQHNIPQITTLNLQSPQLNCLQTFDESKLNTAVEQLDDHTPKRLLVQNCMESSSEIQYHHIDRFKCSHPDCTFEAESKRKVTCHYRNHHKPLLNCAHPNCQYKTSSKNFLKAHGRAHFGIKPYRCKLPLCNYSSAYWSCAITHIKAHLNRYNRHSNQPLTGGPKDYVEVMHELL